MYVCICHGVTDRDIRETLLDGAETAEEVAACTGAGTCCGACRPTVEAMVEAFGDEARASRRSLRVLTTAA
jgi:bacterioferritin-associated ferredoxin